MNFLQKIKETKPNISVSISIVALVTSIFGAGFSYYTFNKTLPLSSANLVFSEENVRVSYSGLQSEAKEDDKVHFEPRIQNIGLSPAEDVHFKLYVVFEDQELSFKNTDTDVLKGFDDSLRGVLQPNSTATFGSFSIDRIYDVSPKNSSPIDLLLEREPFVLVYSLEYKDTLTNSVKSACYSYRFNFGNDSVSTLTRSDYAKVANRFHAYSVKKNEQVCL